MTILVPAWALWALLAAAVGIGVPALLWWCVHLIASGDQ